MQDRYTGDVGDFGKYGLLKALCADDLSLGVVWYLVPDEEGGGDGSDLRYLEPLGAAKPSPRNEIRFKRCGPLLYDTLREMVRSGARSVKEVREREILPKEAVYYGEHLSFKGMQGTGRRLERRKAWAWDALAETRGCDVVFADPDNGLESKKPRHYLEGPKFAYFDELVPYHDRGQSLVVYHHLGRRNSHESQVRQRLSQVNEKLGSSFGLHYRPGSGRAFFVVPSEAHREVLHERAERFARDPCWSQHFTLIEPDDGE